MDLILSGPAPACKEVGNQLQQHLGSNIAGNYAATGKSVRYRGIDPDRSLAGFVAAQCASRSIDHAFVAPGLQMAQSALLAMDMDSTLITIECIDELAGLYGVRAEVARITEATMKGEIADFQTSLMQRLALLAGAPAGILEQVYVERLQLSPGALPLLDAARRHGLKTLLVSGGFTFFTERLKARLNLDFTLANTLEVQDDRLTGRILGPIVDADAKDAMLTRVCQALGITRGEVIAIGDGANDLKMMAGSGLSVAYHAKPVVAEAADQAIRHGGLDVLLDWFDDAL